jgi:hypothetical protein
LPFYVVVKPTKDFVCEKSGRVQSTQRTPLSTSHPLSLINTQGLRD